MKEYTLLKDKVTECPSLILDREWPDIKATNPLDIVEELDSILDLRYRTEEHVYIILIAQSQKVQGIFEVSHGTLTSSYIGTKEIFTRVILSGASGFIVVHNHPSGDCNPSQADIEATEFLDKASKLMGVVLLDHIIVGDELFSFVGEKYL